MSEQSTHKHGIFDKPLPVILDEIQTAAAEARKAADDAKFAGETAAAEVMRRFRKLFLKMARDIQEQLSEGQK